jgi:hypothetical protein
VLERVVALAVAARVGFLARVARGVREEAVFEVVDPDLRGFLVGDRAEMPRDLSSCIWRKTPSVVP